MSKVRLNLSLSIPTQIDQGTNTAAMSGTVMGATEPLVVALNTANSDLSTKHADFMQARQAQNEASNAVRVAARAQRTAYGNLGGQVQTVSAGDASFILSCGFGVRSTGTPNPAVVDAPDALRTKVNGTPGSVYLNWAPPTGAQFFEVQNTTDLSGATGWVTPPEMPTKTRATFTGLTSGTRYAFRVRAWGNGQPGPWSTPIQQMVL